MTSRRVTIAYCADQTMRVPLHVSVHSLLEHLNTEICLYLLVRGFTERQKSILAKEAYPSKFVADVVFLDPDPELFSRLPAFHGSRAVYDRLLLPSLVAEDRLLYIDVDTLIQADLSDLLDLELGEFPLGASVEGSVERSRDKKFRLQLGHELADGEFNAGVLLMNARVWREQNLLDRCLDFGRQYTNEILVADQTILNCVFNRQTVNFPTRFNSYLREAAIRHFGGSPKPWDVGGRWLVDGAEDWYKALDSTNLSAWDKAIRPQDWYRLPKIISGYQKFMKKRLTLYQK